MNGLEIKKRLGRLARKLVFLCLIYVVGFVSAIYWAVSPGTDAADAAACYRPTAVSISRAAHKSVDYAQAAAEKTGDFVSGQSEEAEQSEQK